MPEAIKGIVVKERTSLRQKMKSFSPRDHAAFRKIGESLGKSSTKRVRASPEMAKAFTDLLDLFVFEGRSAMFIRDMSLVYLVAIYESFLQRILLTLFEKKPEAMTSGRKPATTEELISCRSVEEVRQLISDKEVRSVMCQDVESIRNYFRERFSVELSKFTDWKQFIERFYRRNIIVHNSGFTNETYRTKTGYKGKDKRMTVSQIYLDESIQLFEDAARRLSEHFQRKFTHALA